MYQEYAIDPTTLCKSFDRFKLIWNGLGYSEGRLLSRFPGSWAKKVIKSQSYEELPDGLSKKGIENLLIQEAKARRKSISSGREFDSNSQTWLEAAEQAHSTQPFHSILSESNPRAHEQVACFDELGVEGDCWSTESPWQIKRHHTDMAKAAAPLLRASKEILFIEPYFGFDQRFTRPLNSFLAGVADYARSIDRLEIHLKHRPDEGTEEYFIEEFMDVTRAKKHFCCPRNGAELLAKLEFFIWESPDDNRMHPRYILTDVAGLGFENGLDEDMNGDTFTDVSLLAGASLARRWREFQPDSEDRRLIHSFKASSC